MYRRHLSDCAHLAKGNAWIRCQCPIWVQGSIGGEAIRRSLNTTNWTAASTTVHQWQSSGRVGLLKPELPDLVEAIQKFLAEAKTRNLAATTIKKRRELLEGKLLTYCKRKGYRHLRDLTVERLRDFRHGWKYSPLSAAKRLEYVTSPPPAAGVILTRVRTSASSLERCVLSRAVKNAYWSRYC
jgi:hypothetical protein